MRKSLFKGKSTRTKIFTAISAAGILLLLCLNMLLTYLCSSGLVIIDLTPERFYTLSEKMKEACSEILDKTDEDGNKKQIKITFCCEPDYLTGNDHMRTTYFMALALRNMFDNVKVETVDVLRNPTAVSQYKTTSKQNFATTDMIVSYGAKYRVVDADKFWLDDDFSYNGEYRMVSILASLTAIDNPKVYFLSGHGESYYDPKDPDGQMSSSYTALRDLLEERGLKIDVLDLQSEGRVPEDCALLIINAPTEDLKDDPTQYDKFGYISEAEMLDRYLVSNAGALIVNKGYDTKPLPILESFLLEWGIGFSNSLVKDVDNCLSDVGEEGTTILGVYDTSELGIGSAYYGEYSSVYSAPKVVFTNSGYVYNAFDESDASGEAGSYKTSRIYSHFLGTSDTAVSYEGPGSTVLTSGEGMKSLAVMAARDQLDAEKVEHIFSYVFCTNTADFFKNELLGNPSYANYAVMSAVVSNISRTDRFASVELGGKSLNSPSYGGKQTQSTTLSETDTYVYSSDAKEILGVNKGFSSAERSVYTVIVFIAPTTLLILCVAMYIRRKFL